MKYEHTMEAVRDAQEMERWSILAHDATDEHIEIHNLRGQIEDLESDCMTMALRLLGEDFDTFAPETREVMERWGRKAYELLNEVPK